MTVFHALFPVLSVRLDPRGPALRGDSVLSHHTEHVPGNIHPSTDFLTSIYSILGSHLVHHADYDGHH